jgi:small-conductance mechanosensitive channel
MNGIDTLPELLAALIHPTALLELAVLVACLGLAGLAAVRLRPKTEDADQAGLWFGRRGFDGVLFPLLALALALLAKLALRGHMPVAVFQLAVPVLASLALIRVAVRVLHAAFPTSDLVRSLERSLSWAVWIGAVLWITGLLPVMLTEMEAISWKIGGSPVSLRSLVEGGLSAVAVMLVMLWLSATIESRLLRASSVNLSVRKMAANATRAVLLLVGLLVAMSAAGIPLGALSVLGGAVGVGIGLGLQKLAANYVSGFVILAERSLRIGDVVKVDNFEGRITDISTRYTVIRAPNGRESIVPNEMMITQRVENCSFADPNVALTSTVQVAYGTDVPALIPRLVATMTAVPRVLSDPAPSVQLSNFAADGLELTLVFWIADIENGQGNVRSGVNLAVLDLLNASGVEIPFPQRVWRAADGPAPAVTPPAVPVPDSAADAG